MTNARFRTLIPTLLFCSMIADPARTDEGWTYIGREEQVNGFQLNQKGKLHYNGKQLKNFELQKTADKVAISPLSPGGKHAVAFSFGDVESQCALLQLDQSSSTVISLEAPPMIWSNWSPDGSYLLLASLNGEKMTLYSVGVTPLNVRKIPVDVVKKEEMLEFDTGSVNWSDPAAFEMEAAVRCSSQSPGCTSQQQDQIIRSYKLELNASTLSVQAKELPRSAEPEVE